MSAVLGMQIDTHHAARCSERLRRIVSAVLARVGPAVRIRTPARIRREERADGGGSVEILSDELSPAGKISLWQRNT